MSEFFKDEKGCVKTPTRCLIWTGGKVHCLVTENCDELHLEDLIKKIGCKLKDIYKEISINDIDFLDLLGEKECPPGNLSALIQIMITKIQELIAASGSNTNSELNIQVSVADCLISAAGSETMLIEDYVELLGVQICEMQTTIQEQNQLIVQMQNQLTSLQQSVEALIGG